VIVKKPISVQGGVDLARHVALAAIAAASQQ
jgi:hypothetical protein